MLLTMTLLNFTFLILIFEAPLLFKIIGEKLPLFFYSFLKANKYFLIELSRKSQRNMPRTECFNPKWLEKKTAINSKVTESIG